MDYIKIFDKFDKEIIPLLDLSMRKGKLLSLGSRCYLACYMKNEQVMLGPYFEITEGWLIVSFPLTWTSLQINSLIGVLCVSELRNDDNFRERTKDYEVIGWVSTALEPDSDMRVLLYFLKAFEKELENR